MLSVRRKEIAKKATWDRECTKDSGLACSEDQQAMTILGTKCAGQGHQKTSAENSKLKNKTTTEQTKTERKTKRSWRVSRDNNTITWWQHVAD